MYLFRLQICGLLIKIMYIWKLALTFSAMWAPGHQITAVLICSHIALLLVIIHIHTYIIVSFCASNLSLLRWRHFSAFLEFLFFFHARAHTHTHTQHALSHIPSWSLYYSSFFTSVPLSLPPYKCYFILISNAGATLHHDWMFHTLDNRIRYLGSSVCSFY